MLIRPVQSADADTLMRIFRLNVPAAFGVDEVTDYAHFLQTNTDPYFVAEHDEQIVGAGGYYLRADGQTARITWIFTDPATKGLGVGRTVLEHCFDAIRQQPAVRVVETQTSQKAYRFFEKFGFRLQHTKPDYWAPGLDLYAMTKPCP